MPSLHRPQKAKAKSAPPPAPQTSSPLLAPGLMEKLLSTAMSRGADFAEVYVQRGVTTAVTLEEEKIKSAQTGLVQGVGIRVISGQKVGYAYSDDLEEESLFRAAQTAAFIAQGGGAETAFKVSRVPAPSYYRVPTPLENIEIGRKTDLIL